MWGFDDSASSHGRKSSFVSLTSSQKMALCHVVHLSSQGPVSGAADKLPRPWPIQYVASVVGPDSLNTSKELSFFVTGLKT